LGLVDQSLLQLRILCSPDNADVVRARGDYNILVGLCFETSETNIGLVITVPNGVLAKGAYCWKERKRKCRLLTLSSLKYFGVNLLEPASREHVPEQNPASKPCG